MTSSNVSSGMLPFAMSSGAERAASPSVFVTLVSLTIVAVAACTSFVLRSDPYPPAAAANAVHHPLYLLLAFLSLFAYLRTHFTHPGRAALWHLHRPDLPHPLAVPDPELLLPASHCSRCDAPKPPRVHHCTACDACVLRFDHHCPWLATCIGLLNAKFFILFLLYTTLMAAYTIFLHTAFLLHCRWVPANDRLIFVLAFATPLCLAVGVASFFALGGLLLWNCYLAAMNQTALENFRAANSQPVIHYYINVIANLRHLLGWNPWLWLLPFRQTRVPALKTKG